MAGDGTNGPAAPKWLAQPAYTPTRKMRVVCIGAGFAGLMVAHKVQHELKLEDEMELAIYERNPEIGGTWYENTYPGAACDVPAHTYVFPFEGNPDWSSFYVGQAEILAYIKRTAAKYDLCKHVQLETTVRETIWDEASAKWRIKLEHNGEVKEDEADFLINGAGFLNKWKWPDIPGLHDFQGKLLHTAKWDHDYDYTNKKVAVIGNGSSGIQTVTAMQPVVAELVNYMRQPTWISANVLADKTPNGFNFEYTAQQKRAFREDPTALWEYRRELENAINGAFFTMLLDHPLQALFEAQCKEHMASRMASAPELAARLAPGYRPGCRRITPGDGYLEALQQPNCRDSWARITRVTARGLVTTTAATTDKDETEAGGQEEAFDAIVCATGFDSSWFPQWRMEGRGGATLDAQWRDDPVAFFATMVDGFPNYGMVNGPNAPISHGSVLAQMGWTIDFLLKWVMRMNREDIRTLEVKKEAVADFNEYSQAFLQGTVWAGPCRTLYKNGRTTGRITGLYAGSMGHFRDGLAAAAVAGEHFHLTWRSPNRFRCLGNGQAATDRNGSGDLAPYMARPPAA